ncbi:tRNA pseudouridine(38-40) synthase TruA [Yunchengibacter salinarum]|uniref:tRNA pseudouridine(38-40) synthase TruA n=1 Tax=Yunchengibacter salinarum TaxID=3133399 RepID=UPI0035B68606
MPRYRLDVEYDGRPFVGWQRQKNGLGVQQVLEEAVAGFAPQDSITVQASGRTDAGVHASGMVAHVDIVRDDMAPDRIQGALNHFIRPHPVAVLAVSPVAPDWHARFSCRKRHYLYRIITRRAPLTFDQGLAWRVPQDLNVAAMHEAAQALVGQHDFTTFRHVACQADSPVKTLDYLDVSRRGDEVLVRTGARSFLHHQVRSMVGTLALVGRGQWPVSAVAKALAARDRGALGFNAPPDGLYFLKADYPADMPTSG